MGKKAKQSKVKQTIFAIAVALLFVFFVAYATQTLYPSPQYNDYCDEFARAIPLDAQTQGACEDAGGTWNMYPDGKTPDGREGYCDFYTQCNEDYRNAREPYERNIFIFNLLVGLVVLIAAFFLSVEAISTGFMGGGALLMIYGTLRYWGNLSNGLRTLFLGLALAILVYFGYKKLKD